jgi:glycosyltransferase involved in cell wall biosynthesis
MRIAVVTWSSRRVGGVEDYLSLLLPAMQRVGVELAFWHEVDTPADRDRVELPAGTLDICAADAGQQAAIQQLRDWKPDVLYVQGIQNVATEAKLLDIAPAVFFLHTYTGTCISGIKTFARPTTRPCDRTFGLPCLVHYLPHGCGGNDPVTMWRLFTIQKERLALFRRYAVIFTLSDHMRHEMANHGLRADVLPYPVDIAAPPSDTTSANGVWRLLFAGRMEWLKGGHYLIDALPEIARAAGRPVHATMAGDGRQRLNWEAAAHGVQRGTSGVGVEFTGWVTRSQIGELLKNCDVLVVPSLWPEPFGAIGAIAAQHGVPAVGFNSGGIPEWLADGISGHLADAHPPTPRGLAGAVIRCLDDPAHHAALKRGATQMGSRFTMAHHLPPLMEVLQRPKGMAQQ